VVSSHQTFRPITCMNFSSPHACYIPRPSHPPRFAHPNNNIRWRVQVIKLYVMQFSLTSCLLILLHLRSKFSTRPPKTMSSSYVRGRATNTSKVIFFYILILRILDTRACRFHHRSSHDCHAAIVDRRELKCEYV
jgi:hypothetical protein